MFRRNKICIFVFLFVTFFVYSLSGVFTKLASMQQLFSRNYFLLLFCAIIVLGMYASLWQKVLSFMPLNKAFLCKSVTLILGLLVAHFIFSEVITISNIVGAFFILGGLVVLSCKQ